MKKLISLLLAALLAFSCFAVAGTAFYGGAGIDYRTKTYNAADYATKYVVSKEVLTSVDGSKGTTTYTYDDAGNVIKRVYKEPDISSTTTYAYDSKGNITKRAFKNDVSGYRETETFAYSGGLVSKQTFKSDDGSDTSFSYAYDSKGRLTKKTTVSADSGSKDYYIYSYDENGNVSKIVTKDDNSVSNTTTYTYDSSNRLTKEVSKYETVTYETVYTYDKNGNTTKIVETGGEEYSNYTTTRSFDSKNNLLSDKTVYGDTVYDTQYVYDSSGRLTKETYKIGDSTMFVRKLAYDSNGNMSKETYKTSAGTSFTTYSYKKLTKAIVKADAVTLSYASVTANGKARKPAVKVEGALNGADYRLVYSNNVKPGKAQVKIIFLYPQMGSYTIKYDIVPGKVTGLKASSVKTTSLKLSWTKVTGAKYYQVQRSTDGKNWTWVSKGTDKASVSVSKLKAGTKYQFRVRALDSTKKFIGAFVVLKTGTQTAAPKISKLTTRSKQITVTWGKVTGAKSYTVYTSTDGKTYKAAKSGVTKTTCTITGLRGGRRIYVKVLAVNAYKVKSAYSGAKYITVKR